MTSQIAASTCRSVRDGSLPRADFGFVAATDLDPKSSLSPPGPPDARPLELTDLLGAVAALVLVPGTARTWLISPERRGLALPGMQQPWRYGLKQGASVTRDRPL